MVNDQIPKREVSEFWDLAYASFDAKQVVDGALALPAGAGSIAGKSLLIVACGTGKEVVRAAREAGAVTAIDISANAVSNARAMIEQNGLSANFAVCDAADTGLPDATFDVIWGSAVLHHLHHAETAAEFARILKPGGKVIMMGEPTFFNPVLRWSYETAFGKGRTGRRRRFLMFTRIGDEYEKPIDDVDLQVWRPNFDIEVQSRGFMFIEKMGHVLTLNRTVRSGFAWLDRMAVWLIPNLKRFGYEHDFVLTMKSSSGVNR